MGQDWPAGVAQVPGVFEHVGGGLQARPLVLQTPGVGWQFAFAVHVIAEGVTQVPFWDGHVALVEQLAPPTVHVPLPGVWVHCDAIWQGVPGGFTQVPFTVGHVAAEVQDAKGALLHVPGVCEHCALDVHCVVEGVVQVPAGTHGLVVPLQATPVTLQVPPRIAQLLAVVHDSPSLLQCPTWEQSLALMQLVGTTLHKPG